MGCGAQGPKPHLTRSVTPEHRAVLDQDDLEALPGCCNSGTDPGQPAAGNGKILENGDVRALDVKVGDKVLFGKYAGTEVKVDGEELLVMKEDDIMAVIES